MQAIEFARDKPSPKAPAAEPLPDGDVANGDDAGNAEGDPAKPTTPPADPEDKTGDDDAEA
jgi:hypothetical protein